MLSLEPISLQQYADIRYFAILLTALIPLAISIYYGKRAVLYECLVSLAFVAVMFTDDDHWHAGVAIIGYVVWQFVLAKLYSYYRRTANNRWVFYAGVFGAILPILLTKLATPFHATSVSQWISFLGISYLTFRSVGVIMELRDGSIKRLNNLTFLRFLLFMPALSSGPIDRYRRFESDIATVPDRDKYLDYLADAVRYLFIGFLYKFVIAHYLLELQTYFQNNVLTGGPALWSNSLVPYMYVYGLHMFFDFAGYSFFAVAVAKIMGIDIPMNFNKPFLSKNLKEFWNRWHMSLSFWFRDYVFMRFVFTVVKSKRIKSRITISNLAYVLNMVIMGFWHGITWFYIAYGLFHGVGLIINDAWLRYKKRHKNLPHNRWTEWLAIIITFHIVMISLLLFSGILDKLWFGHH